MRLARSLVEQLRAALDDAGRARPVRLDAPRAAAFLRWSLERGNTRKWVADQRRALTWWRRRLRGDLRELSVVQVLRCLRGQRSRALKIAVLKRLTSWLVSVEFVLEDDPLRALHVPQAQPAQWRRTKVVDQVDLVEVRERLSPRYRDALDVLRGTCWHLTELERFARAGEIREPLPMELETRRAPGCRVAGVLQTTHKAGRIFLTAVSRRTLAAAVRVRARGGICISHFAGAIRRACRELGLRRPWCPGQLRHTGASFALARGVSLRQVADYLGHVDPRTTRRWYAVHVAAPKVPTLL